MTEAVVIGITDGTFYLYHIPALWCIFSSLICAILVLVASWYLHDHSFFSWGKSERFVVYLALSDGLFSIVKACDHIQMIATENNVQPIELCAFYAFIIEAIISMQLILELIIAINAFVMMRFRFPITFGEKDWKLFLGILAFPITVCIVAASANQLGATGVYCGIKGNLANLSTSTVPITIIFITNAFLYIATLYHIRKEAKSIGKSIGGNTQSARGYRNAAKIMSMFVIAFFLHWWALTASGIYELQGESHPILLRLNTTFTNLGGVFNGIVFLLIRFLKKRNQRIDRRERRVSANTNTQSSTNFDSKT